MRHDTIQLLFYISFIGGLGVGIFIFIGWGKKVFNRMLRTFEGPPIQDASSAGMATFIYMLPGALLFLPVVSLCFTLTAYLLKSRIASQLYRLTLA